MSAEGGVFSIEFVVPYSKFGAVDVALDRTEALRLAAKIESVAERLPPLRGVNE